MEHLDCKHTKGISIHALLAESDMADIASFAGLCNFYPRSPCGERPHVCHLLNIPVGISIHALLAESDVSLARYHAVGILFLSTLSLRRATIDFNKAVKQLAFLSTLSLRRATFSLLAGLLVALYFYPRSPCGERPGTAHGGPLGAEFLSTLSLRRATPCNTLLIYCHL